MASEIRVNSISSRSGLSTITFGAYGVEIAGITTISQLNVNSGTNAQFAGVVTASAFYGNGSNLTGIDATALKDSNGNVKIQAQASGAVVTGILTTGNVTVGGATTSLVVNGDLRVTGVITTGTSTITLNGNTNTITVGNAFLSSTAGVGLGSTTTAGRNAGVGTVIGSMIFNSDTQSIESYSGAGGWRTVKNMQQITQYFVYTSPTTANLTSTYNFGPDATVDILHLSTGANGSSGSPGNPGNDSGGQGGAGGAGGSLNYKIGQTIAQTGTSFPVTTPSYPSPAMPSPQPGGGPYAGGPGNPGPNMYAGIPGTNASFTITPFAPYFPAYTLSNGNGGAGGPGGNSQFAGDGGSGGGGGLIVAPNGALPAPLAPSTDNTIIGTAGGTASGTGGRNPGPGGSGGQGYGAGGGGGAGGAEHYGSTTGGAGGGAGSPGIMIIKVTGYQS